MREITIIQHNYEKSIDKGGALVLRDRPARISRDEASVYGAITKAASKVFLKIDPGRLKLKHGVGYIVRRDRPIKWGGYLTIENYDELEKTTIDDIDSRLSEFLECIEKIEGQFHEIAKLDGDEPGKTAVVNSPVISQNIYGINDSILCEIIQSIQAISLKSEESIIKYQDTDGINQSFKLPAMTADPRAGEESEILSIAVLGILVGEGKMPITDLKVNKSNTIKFTSEYTEAILEALTEEKGLMIEARPYVQYRSGLRDVKEYVLDDIIKTIPLKNHEIEGF